MWNGTDAECHQSAGGILAGETGARDAIRARRDVAGVGCPDISLDPGPALIALRASALLSLDGADQSA
jgi:hypothetical protein